MSNADTLSVYRNAFNKSALLNKISLGSSGSTWKTYVEDSSIKSLNPAVYLRVEKYADKDVWSTPVHFSAVPADWACVTPISFSTAAASRRFQTLWGLIDEMSTLPEGTSDAVDGETAGYARNMLSLIQQYDVPPPTIFSHGGDALVFNWDLPTISRYMTISGNGMAVLDINRLSHLKCPYPTVDLDTTQVTRWLPYLRPASRAVEHAGK